jgi:hypothetical protein
MEFFPSDDLRSDRSKFTETDQQLLQFSQGCQMVYFQTKNPNVGKFGRFLQWKMLEHFMTMWSIL